MKSKLLLLLLLTTFLNAQTFQNNIEVANKNYHDLNISEPFLDGTQDYLVAGNLLDNTTNTIALKRIDQNGNVVWNKEYDSASFPNSRVFDVYSNIDLIFMTGSVDDGINGLKVFVARIDAQTGVLSDINYYDILSSSLQSVGYHITYTDSDADGDTVPDPGLLIAGTFGSCSPLVTNTTGCSLKEGFVMRLDFALNEIWTTEVETLITSNPIDYDFVNHITETSDGFFITGSATGQNPANNNWQQIVLAHKINFQGVMQWDNSYLFGNANDVSVDAYYDVNSNNIFMLANYSASHQFGVTVFDNSNGVMSAGQSWYVTNNDLDHYGFSLIESLADPNNLIVTGYDREETWSNSSNSFTGKTNVFVYEFVKATGAEVTKNYQYLVLNDEIVIDPYNFWDSQMPLIYYPDISFSYVDNTGVELNYFHIGYKNDDPSINFTNSNIFKTPVDKLNECDNLELNFIVNPISIQNNFNVGSGGGLTVTKVNFTMADNDITFVETDCEPVLAVNDEPINSGFIYPNPVSETLYFNISNVAAIKIYDSLGRVVKQNTAINNNSIHVENLTNGIYFIEINTNANQIQIFKFLKN
tara:strand:+ start:4137 stop:5894 length:1758 start_codon:yes stop_codon:yes gene_type:complete